VGLGAAPRPYLDLDGLGGFIEPRAFVDEARKVVTGIEETGERHGE